MKAKLIYYEPIEVQLGPVRLTLLRKTREEEVEIGDEKDVDRLYERLSRLVAEARKRHRNVIIEARVKHGDRELYYAESSMEGGGSTLLYYRPARIQAITIVREMGSGYVRERRPVSQEAYVYEGRVYAQDPKIAFIIVETVDGKRVVRRSEFTSVTGGGGERGTSGEARRQRNTGSR